MITQKVKKRLIGKGRGAVFTPSDFLDLGARAAVDQALSRLADRGVIRRLARGLYDYPKHSPRLGALSPDIDCVVQALARKDDHVIQISPARAANLFGLTTQVPAKPVYFTDGPTRSKQIGRQSVTLRNAAAKTLLGAGRPAGAVFQALRYLGKGNVDAGDIDRIRQGLSDQDRADVAKLAVKAPVWMQPIAQRIADDGYAMAA